MIYWTGCTEVPDHTTGMNISLNLTEPGELTLTRDGYIAVAAFLLLTGVFGILSNGISLVMFMKDKFQTSVDILLFNLAITDLGMVAFCFPFVVSANFAQRWLYGDIGCTVYGFFGFLFGNCSIMTLSAISIERYYIVCRKQSASVSSRQNFLVKTILITWCYCLMWAVIPLVTGVGYGKEPFGTSCSVRWSGQRVKDKVFIGSLVVFVVIANIVIMSYCYVNILFVSRLELQPQRRRHNRHLTRLCFILAAVFLLCWLPYALISLFSTFGQAGFVPVWLTVVPVMAAKLSACVNPFIYVLYSERLRKRYIALLTVKKWTRTNNAHTNGIKNTVSRDFMPFTQREATKTEETAV